MSSSSSSSSWYYPDAESYTISDKKPLHLLNPNQFYKICPGLSGGDDDGNGNGNGDGTRSGYSWEDQPICGDGSPFCFYFSKPSQMHSNRDKLLIEIMGGGACWDSDTCDRQADMLYVNENLDDVLGKSCQEVQYGFEMDGATANMLCSAKLGNNESSEGGSSSSSSVVDFTRYNAIVIPYCTQDVHLGSNTMVYSENDDDNNDDGGNNNNARTVHHKGANNLKAVLKWVYHNFPNLRHASVTGCSAGGTAVPVVEQLLHKHYNHFGNRATQVASMSDSPVYLTPTYFLENALDHWDPEPILSSIGIPYEKFRSSEDYPTMMWDYILRKGNNKNRWGFVSHTEDPVSLAYYQYMGGGNEDGNNNNDEGNYGDDGNYGNYGDDDYNNNRNRFRRLDNNDDLSDQWYSEMTSSISYIEKRHRNVKSYWMESEGHCSFGLYYALQEDDFPSFAASVFREDTLLMSAKPAVGAFFLAALTGTLLLAGLVIHRIRRQSSLQVSAMHIDDEPKTETTSAGGGDIPILSSPKKENEKEKDGVMWAPATGADNIETLATRRSWSFRKKFRSIMVAMDDYPVTAGYTLWITVYFLAMLASEGFAHPINNPSLGPSALGLSVFGINNPSLIVYYHQWFRLFTSNFLVSGVLTLVMAYIYLWHRIRKLEERMIHDFKSPWLFVTIIIVLATTINASYCLFPPRRGASTAAIPLLIGLQAFHLTFYWNSFVRPFLSIGAIGFDTIVVVTLFPFNSWVMIVAALVTGWITAKIARTMDVWLPGPMMNILRQNGIQLELGSTNGSVVTPGGHGRVASFGTALSFPPCPAVSESEYNNFDGNLSNSYETMDDQRSDCPDHTRSRRGKFLKRAICCSFSALFVLLLVPLFVTLVATPNEAYLEPFRTGCKSFYTVDIDDLSASSFLSGGGDDDGNGNAGRALSLVAAASYSEETTTESFFRWLAGGDNDDDGGRSYGCAEFCVPHLLVPFVKGVLRKKEIPIDRGRCSDNGYSTHVLDKTFTALSYSLDVELYAAYNGGDDDGNNQ
jgi:hypothetical protein